HIEDPHGVLLAVVRVQAVRRVYLAITGALLGRHENDAVRPATAVDRGGRRVLEHVDSLDDLRVEVLNGPRDRDAVDYIERLGAGRERPTARDWDVHPGARLIVSRHDVDAGKSTLQSLHRIRRRDVLELRRLNRSDGAGHRASVRGAVTDRDDRI